MEPIYNACVTLQHTVNGSAEHFFTTCDVFYDVNDCTADFDITFLAPPVAAALSESVDDWDIKLYGVWYPIIRASRQLLACNGLVITVSMPIERFLEAKEKQGKDCPCAAAEQLEKPDPYRTTIPADGHTSV